MAAKASGKKTRGPVFSLKRAVAEAYELFPRFKDRIFFIDLDTNKVVHPDPVIRSQLINLMNANDELREMVNIQKYRARMSRSSICMEIAANGHAIRFMALYLKKDMQNIFSKDHPLSKTRFSVFDHELAHAIIPEARDHKVKAESIADSYMALRHFQRYGPKSQTMNSLMRRRAVMAFFNQDADHFTTPALEKILEVKDKINVETLSPQKAAKLAARIGTKYTINEKEQKSLSRQFNKLRGALVDTMNDQPLRDFAEMVFRTKSPLMQKWGRVALSAFLDGDIHIQKSVGEDKMQTISLRGKYWDHVRTQITALAAQ